MLIWFAQTTLVAAGLSALALGLGRVGKLGPEARHALWLVVLAKFLIPPLVAWPWPLPTWPEPEPTPAPFEVAATLPAPPPPPIPAVEGDRPRSRTLPDPSPGGGGRGPTDGSGGGVPTPATQGQSSESAAPPPVEPMPDPLPPPPELEPEPGSGAVPDRTSRAGKVGQAPLVPRLSQSPFPRPLGSSEGRSEPEPPGFPRPALRWADAALAAWLCGAVVVAGRLAWRVARFRRSLLGSVEAPPWLAAEAASLADRLGVAAPPIVLAPGVATPLLWCLGRPRLILPTSLVDRLAADRWPGILAHELAHLARRDHWVVRLELLAGAVWWWNPLFWLVRRRLHAEAELACDARVVRALPSHRFTYAETLVEVCERMTRPDIPAPALGVRGPGPARSLETRLTMILRDPIPRRPLGRRATLVFLLLAALALPAWTLGQQTPAARAHEAGRCPETGRAGGGATAGRRPETGRPPPSGGHLGLRVADPIPRVGPLDPGDPRGGGQASGAFEGDASEVHRLGPV